MKRKGPSQFYALRVSLARQSKRNLLFSPWSGPYEDDAPRSLPWCFYCGVVMTDPLPAGVRRKDTERTRDHVVPRSSGIRSPHNIVECCLACNLLKGTRSLLEFMLLRVCMIRSARNVSRANARQQTLRRRERSLEQEHQLGLRKRGHITTQEPPIDKDRS